LRSWKINSKESPELPEINVSVFYIGSSLLAPLKTAEQEINRDLGLGLSINAFNFGGALSEAEWLDVDLHLSEADVVFVIHVMDGENAARLLLALEKYKQRHRAVVVINCRERGCFPQSFRQRSRGRRARGGEENRCGQGAAWYGQLLDR
jgi:hypothetical protein